MKVETTSPTPGGCAAPPLEGTAFRQPPVRKWTLKPQPMSPVPQPVNPRASNTDKKNLRGNGPENAKLTPSPQKTAKKNYVDTTSDRAAISGTVITCYL